MMKFHNKKMLRFAKNGKKERWAEARLPFPPSHNKGVL